MSQPESLCYRAGAGRHSGVLDIKENLKPMKLDVLMAPAKSPPFRDSTYDGFLFAVVGEERNGMSLSVVSALARLDLDPWVEAASLSRLSTQAAEARLTSLLSSLPRAQLETVAPAMIVRLVALLPRPRPDALWVGGPSGLAKPTKPWPWSNISSFRSLRAETP